MGSFPKSGIQLTAQGADVFIRDLARAQGAIDAFRKTASTPTPFAAPDTRSATRAFNDLQQQAQRSGQQAGSSMASGFQTGLSPLSTIMQGALLSAGGLITSTITGIFSAAGREASEAFGNALDFGQAIADITAITGDASGQAADLIAQSVQAAATSPTLFVGVDQAAATAKALLKTGQDVTAVTETLLEDTILLQNAGGDAAGTISDYNTAAELVGRGLQLFGENSDQAGNLVDSFSAILNNSAIKNLNDLRYVLLNSGTAIQTLGLDFDELAASTIATAASFSSGRTQGTALESFVTALANPTDKAKTALQQLGIAAFDAQGKFVGFAEIQRQLKRVTNDGIFTQEALIALLSRGFGDVGSGFAIALAGAEDLSGAMMTVEQTSAAAIAAIRTDTPAAALNNLADQFSALGVSLFLPLTEQLQPAILAMSSLLQALAGYVANLGQAIASTLSPVITFFTGQINALTNAISGLTGFSFAGITAPTAAAAPIGPQPRPESTLGVGADRESTFSSGAATSALRDQEAIGLAQLDAAKGMQKSTQAIESALGSIEGVFNLSKVTQTDLDLGDAYQEKADEFVRQLEAAANSGGKEFAETIPQAREALTRIGIVPSDDLKVLAAQIKQAWADSSLFAAEENIALINEEAIVAAAEAKEKAALGRANLVKAFGSLVDQLVEGTNQGLSGGAGYVPPAVVPPVVEPTDPTAFIDPYDLYVKPVQDAQIAKAQSTATQQEGAFTGLFAQFDTLEERLGGVGLLFGGLNTILDGITKSVEGQDFTAAGTAVSATLTTVLGALTGITELADLGATTESLSSFVTTLLTAAGDLATGIDAETITTSASGLITAVVEALTGAIDGIDLTGITTAAAAMLVKVTALLVDAVNGVDFTGIGTAAGTLVSTAASKITDALNDPAVATDLATAGANFATATIGAIQGSFSTLGDALATADEDTDAGEITTAISGFMTTLIARFTGEIAGVKLEGITSEIAGMIASIANLFVEAVDGVDFEGIGSAIGKLASTLGGIILGAFGDPATNATLTSAVSGFVGGILDAATGAFALLGEAVAVADEGIDAGAITTAIGDFVISITDGFTSGIAGADLTTITTDIAGMIANIANLFVEAINGVDYAGIGTAIGELIGTIGTKVTDAFADPAIGEQLGTAAGDFVSGIVKAVQGAFALLGSALTGVDDTLDISALTDSIDGIVTGFVDGFIAAITRNFTNPDTGAVEITIPTIAVTPIDPIDLSALVSFTGKLVDPLGIDQSTLVTYTNELPTAPEVDRATAIKYINELPSAFQVEKDKLVSYINELTPGEEVDRAKLVTFANALPASEEIDRSTLVNYINALPAVTEVDLSTDVVTVTGDLPVIDANPLTEAINSIATVIGAAGTVISAADILLQGSLGDDGPIRQLQALFVTLTDSLTASIEDVDVDSIGGALNDAILSVTGLFVTLSEIPDLGPITSSVGGLVEALINLATGTALNLDGEAIGGDVATFASNLVTRLSEAITAVPLEEIGVAAANLIGAITQALRDAFTLENLGAVGESLGGLVTGIVEQLTATLGNPEFGAALGDAFGDLISGIITGAAGLLQGFNEGLDGEAFAGIGDAIYTFITSFVDGMAASLGETDWSSVAQAIYDGLTGAIGKLFSAAEGAADAIFGAGAAIGGDIATALGGAGSFSFITDAATSLQDTIATSFASDAIYQAETNEAILGAGTSLSGAIALAFDADTLYPASISEGLANIGKSLTAAFSAISDAVSGFLDGLIGLYNTVAGGLGLPTIGAEAEPETPESAKIAEELNKLNTSQEQLPVNLANAITNTGGQIDPTMDIGPTLQQIQQDSANASAAAIAVTTDAANRLTSFDPAAYAGAGTFDGTIPVAIQNPEVIAQTPAQTFDPAAYEGAGTFEGTIPVTIQNPEAIAPQTTNADGSLTAAGQERAAANAAALLSGLGAAIAPAFSDAAGAIGGAIGGALSNLPSAQQASIVNPLETTTTGPVGALEVKPVELSESAVTQLNNFATAQTQAQAQGQDTAAVPPSVEALLGAQANQLQAYAYQSQQQGDAISMVASSLVSTGIDPGAAGLGGDYGPPLVQAVDNLTATVAAGNAVQPTAALGDREPLEYGPDTQKLIEEQTEAIILNTAGSQETATDDPASLIGPKTAQELKVIETNLPNASTTFITSLGSTGTSAGNAGDKLNDLTDSADDVVTVLDDTIDAADGVTGSLNTFLDKSDDVGESLGTLNETLTDNNIGQSLDDFTSALDEAVASMNAAIKKLDGGSDTTPPADQPTPESVGANAYGGAASGVTLVGERGREIAYNPAGHWSRIVGEQGPVYEDFPAGTYIYPNAETERILARSGGSSESIYSSAAKGFGNLASLLNPGNTAGSVTPSSTTLDPVPLDPIPFPGGPVTIPQGDEGVTADEPTVAPAEAANLFDNPFVQALLRQDAGADLPNALQAAMIGNRDITGALGQNVEDLVELFNRPLFGGRVQPASMVVNINIANNIDNSVRTNNYNLTNNNRQAAGRAIDDIALLKAAFS